MPLDRVQPLNLQCNVGALGVQVLLESRMEYEASTDTPGKKSNGAQVWTGAKVLKQWGVIRFNLRMCFH